MFKTIFAREISGKPLHVVLHFMKTDSGLAQDKAAARRVSPLSPCRVRPVGLASTTLHFLVLFSCLTYYSAATAAELQNAPTHARTIFLQHDTFCMRFLVRYITPRAAIPSRTFMAAGLQVAM
jgi:hypothetical protein